MMCCRPDEVCAVAHGTMSAKDILGGEIDVDQRPSHLIDYSEKRRSVADGGNGRREVAFKKI